MNIRMKGEKGAREINCVQGRDREWLQTGQKGHMDGRDRKERGWLAGCYSLGREVRLPKAVGV